MLEIEKMYPMLVDYQPRSAPRHGRNSVTRQTDHDLDIYRQILTCRYEMLCGICVAQIQPRKHVLDDARHTAPTRQHEPDHTDHGYICPERSTP